MKEIQPLLEKLAEKLGTTANYLWAVLLKQAPISATIYLFQLLFLVIAWYVLYRIHKFLANTPEGDKYNDSYYEKYDIVVGLPMILICLFVLAITIVALLDFNTMITGFFNPEYWALNKILNSIKN